jgi:hypothetical protein
MNQQPQMSQQDVKEAFYKTTFTLKGRIFHPNLLSTRTKTNQATGGSRDVFDVMFAWDPADPSNGPELNKLLGFMNQMSGMVFFGIDPRALVDPIKSDSIQGRAIVVQCLVAIEDEDLHRSHFWVRDYATEGLRPLERYIDAMPEIRIIQNALIERAHRFDVPVIMNATLDQAMGEVLDLVLSTAERLARVTV